MGFNKNEDGKFECGECDWIGSKSGYYKHRKTHSQEAGSDGIQAPKAKNTPLPRTSPLPPNLNRLGRLGSMKLMKKLLSEFPNP